MKFLERVSLTIFSIIILVLSLVMSLLVFGWIKVTTVAYGLQLALSVPTAVNIILVVAVILILLAIKCIFFTSRDKEDKTEGILLENENGKLLISINTIENLVKGVVSGFSNVKSSSCKVNLNRQVNNVKVELNLTVGADTVIKELSLNIQDRIKEVVKQTTELEIKEINIRIKDIENSKQTKKDE